jgi:hypothetical protein
VFDVVRVDGFAPVALVKLKASGLTSAVTLLLAALAGPVPAALVAVTVKV